MIEEKIIKYKLKFTIYYDVHMKKFVIELYSKVYDRRSCLSLETYPKSGYHLDHYFNFLFDEMQRYSNN